MNTASNTATNAPMIRIRRPIDMQRTPERIVITGFMGSGKSTIGPLLAMEMGWSFTDLDLEIERRTGDTISQIFSERGEATFRREETAALVAALGHSRSVIALGGGAPETLGNRLLLEQTPATAIVYLTASFATLSERCARQAANPDAAVRPLLTDLIGSEMRFLSRQPLYIRLAHISIPTENLTPESAVAAVIEAIAARWSSVCASGN